MRQGLSIIAFCLCLAWSATAMAQLDAGVSRLAKSIAAQEELNADLRLATPRATQEADQESARLDDDERNLEAAAVTMSALRQARFDADTRRTRLAGVQDRADFFAEEVRSLDREIALLAQQPPAPPDSLEAYAAALRMAKLRQLRDRMQETVDLYRKSAIAIAGQLDTLNQRLALLQARVDLARSTKRPSSMPTRERALSVNSSCGPGARACGWPTKPAASNRVPRPTASASVRSSCRPIPPFCAAICALPTSTFWASSGSSPTSRASPPLRRASCRVGSRPMA